MPTSVPWGREKWGLFSVQEKSFRWECQGYPERVGLRQDWPQHDE